MDCDFWTSRIVAAKRQYASQHHHQVSHLDRLNIDDFEVEEEARPDFPCPYCYEDFDIGSLCSHLEDEHSYESKVARRRRLCRVSIPNSQALSLLGRDLYDAHLQVLLGDGGYRSNNTVANVSNTTTDSFLSSLILISLHPKQKKFQNLWQQVLRIHLQGTQHHHMWKSRIRASVSARESFSSGGSTVLSFMTFNVGRNGYAHLGVVSNSLQGIKQG
ncbi:hypothetical protein NC652_010553 [Populus alba x Populus x berolinensis]|nr:hypothetical protein NC652_010553 [Populus alba x Populus x berolinensis]